MDSDQMTAAEQREYRIRVFGDILDEIRMDAECFSDDERLDSVERLSDFSTRITFQRGGRPFVLEAEVEYVPFRDHYNIRLASDSDIRILEARRPSELRDVYITICEMVQGIGVG